MKKIVNIIIMLIALVVILQVQRQYIIKNIKINNINNNTITLDVNGQLHDYE